MSVDTIERRFLAAIASQRRSHAYLVSCPDFDRAYRLLRRAAGLLCYADAERSPDTYADFAQFDGSALSRPDIVRLKRELSMSSYAGKLRVILITNVHLLNEMLQNALLKTLEEPPEDTVLLLTGIEANLLPTVRSRCVKVRIPPLCGQELRAELWRMGATEGNISMLERACQGAPDRAAAMLADADAMELYARTTSLLCSALELRPDFEAADKLWRDRDSARTALEFMLVFSRDMLLSRSGAQLDANCDRMAATLAKRFTLGTISDIIGLLVEASRRLGTNVRPQDTAGWLLTRIVCAARR
ncbi:MAG: hypothetical protein Q4B99_00385 [Clostridia bacterium]|nr:hypothetical protein [Clostridia bacterium]